MKTVRIFPLLIFALTIIPALQATAQSTPRQFKESLVLRSMREIHGAQATWQATSGNGNYGTLENLYQASLINRTLARGNMYGYTFVLTATPYSLNPPTPSRFTLSVTPNFYRKTGLRSFFVDESGELHGADRGGLPASVNDPLLDDYAYCSGEGIAGNERCTLYDLRTLHSAEATYQATMGHGNFGTFAQLRENRLIPNYLADQIAHGYSFQIQIIPYDIFIPRPATFRIWATPEIYGVTGIRSFLIDTDGVIRGADRQGQPASETDPPIGN